MRAARHNVVLLVFAITSAVASACYTGPSLDGIASHASPTLPTPPSDEEKKDETVPKPKGLPCEIATLIQTHCSNCHGSPPRGGASTTFASREDFLELWEGRPLGEVALFRMRDVQAPMPPRGPISDKEIETFEQWVEAKMPEGDCSPSSEKAPTPPPSKPNCTSGRFWPSGDYGGSSLMMPGRPCIACHALENEQLPEDHGGFYIAPPFTAAGTLYPTRHEVDFCFGLDSRDVRVVLTGADGRTLSLPVNSAGNFMTEERLELPYTASVVLNGKTLRMETPQKDGDCNGCHMAQGDDSPGRIIAP